MIDVTKLKSIDIGSFVLYIGKEGKELGRIKAWQDDIIFVVYKCDNNWDYYTQYTGVSTNSKALILLR